MSRAFVKESEGDWLGDVSPEITALEKYLTRENDGMKVTLIRKTFNSELHTDMFEMSNGSCYALDEDGRWKVVS